VIYRHAFKHLAQELKKPIVAAFKVVTKTKSPTMERFLVEETAGSIDRQVKIASVMVEGVEREVFLPSPSWAYSTCPWAGLRQPEHLLTCSGVFHVSVGGALPGVVTGQISNIIGGLLPSLLSWKARTARPAILVTLPINSLSARNNALFDSYI